MQVDRPVVAGVSAGGDAEFIVCVTSQDRECHLARGGAVRGGVFRADSTLVGPEGDIKHPVELVLHVPMSPYCFVCGRRGELARGNLMARLGC